MKEQPLPFSSANLGSELLDIARRGSLVERAPTHPGDDRDGSRVRQFHDTPLAILSVGRKESPGGTLREATGEQESEEGVGVHGFLSAESGTDAGDDGVEGVAWIGIQGRLAPATLGYPGGEFLGVIAVNEGSLGSDSDGHRGLVAHMLT